MLHHLDTDCNDAAAFLDVDAAVEVMDPRDRDDLKREQKTTKSSQDERVLFAHEYKGLCKTLRAKRKGVKAQKLPAAIPHEHCKKYLPPGCSAWRGLARGEWWGHCPGYKRVKADWSQHGEQAAMMKVLKTMWQQHCEKNGLDASHIPWQF